MARMTRWLAYCTHGEYTDRLITTGNRQQTTTDPVHSHGKINRSRHRHRLKKGLRWLTFSTDVSKLLIIGCFVCIHDRHHFLTLCQIYSVCRSVMIQASKKYLPLPKNKMADLKKNTNNAPSSHCSLVQFRE